MNVCRLAIPAAENAAEILARVLPRQLPRHYEFPRQNGNASAESCDEILTLIPLHSRLAIPAAANAAEILARVLPRQLPRHYEFPRQNGNPSAESCDEILTLIPPILARLLPRLFYPTGFWCRGSFGGLCAATIAGPLI